MWIQWIAMIGVLIIVCLGIATIYGRYRWQLKTDQLGCNAKKWDRVG